MNVVDKRNKFDDEVFSYHASKDKVFIYWYGKRVTILRGKKAQKFIAKTTSLDHREAQLAMAKVTGNFKRGNEW